MSDKANTIRAGIWSVVFTSAGVLHLTKPQVFDSLVPKQLPGTQRDWSLGSGVMEVGLGVGIAATAMVPTWRPVLHSVMGPAASVFLAGVLPGNIKMAVDFVGSQQISPVAKAIAVARVPLQVPMIASTWRLGS